jgi:hypothetical protein
LVKQARFFISPITHIPIPLRGTVTLALALLLTVGVPASSFAGSMSLLGVGARRRLPA